MKILYMIGKANHRFVPLQFPDDTVDYVSTLAKIDRREFRAKAGIMETNKSFWLGWHVVHNICSSLNLQSTEDMIATNNRYRILTSIFGVVGLIRSLLSKFRESLCLYRLLLLQKSFYQLQVYRSWYSDSLFESGNYFTIRILLTM